MKKFFSVYYQNLSGSLVLFVVRAVTGYAFILHGWGKIQAPMTWMQNNNVPGIFQALAAIAEFGGGIAIILGLFTSIASLGLVVTMIVAALFHAVIRGDPFVAKGGPSYELAITYLLISLILLFIGPGKFALDYKLFGRKSK
jgi:putative oxidoreductase